MSYAHFLLDENIDPDLRAALHRNNPEMTVWIIGDPGAPARGALDPVLLRWCEQNQFALVTNNRSTMPVHLAAHIAGGGHVLGIFIVNPDMSMGETATELILIWDFAESDEFTDQIVYLPL
mgnify:FL=1